MVMEILTQTTPEIAAKTEYSGSTSFNMNSGKSFKIETSPEGVTVLDIQVPSSKTWKVSLTVHIVETSS